MAFNRHQRISTGRRRWARQIMSSKPTTSGRFHGWSGKIEALKGLTLNVKRGEIFGLLGQNGAGKTTLIKILLGITKLTYGSATILGEPAGNVAVRKRIGYLPEDHRFPDYHTYGASLLDFYGSLLDVPYATRQKRIGEILEGGRHQGPHALQDPHLFQRYETRDWASLRRFCMSRKSSSWMSRPTASTPSVAARFACCSTNSRMRARPSSSHSHLLGEVELICDRVVILQRGEIIREGSISTLTKQRGAVHDRPSSQANISSTRGRTTGLCPYVTMASCGK